ncbi:hypothetical protein NQZ68_039021 [Dissostichus eleginoides]|nr:hypothetical protein NQZ68_039021 [Dissostichus eleginoides]
MHWGGGRKQQHPPSPPPPPHTSCSSVISETSSVREKLHSEQDPDHRGLTAAGTCCSFSATFSALLGGFGEFVKRKKKIRVQTLEDSRVLGSCWSRILCPVHGGSNERHTRLDVEPPLRAASQENEQKQHRVLSLLTAAHGAPSGGLALRQAPLRLRRMGDFPMGHFLL